MEGHGRAIVYGYWSTSSYLQAKVMLDELVERTWTYTRKELRTLSLILTSRAQSGAPGSQRVERWLAGIQYVLKDRWLTKCPRRNRSQQLFPGHQELGTF